MSERVEIRCPGKFGKLFLVLTKEFLPLEGTYMEIACSDCLRVARKSGLSPERILHYYDGTGACVQTSGHGDEDEN